MEFIKAIDDGIIMKEVLKNISKQFNSKPRSPLYIKTFFHNIQIIFEYYSSKYYNFIFLKL